MFKDKYKQEMDRIKPSNESISKILLSNTPPRKFNTKRILMIAVASVLVFSLVCSFLISALRTNEAKDKYTEDNKNEIQLQGIRKAESYHEIESALKNFNNNNFILDDFVNDGLAPEMPDIDVDVEEDNNTTDDPDHSDTNNQVNGVQESDVVKNDGKYIYYYSDINRKIYIIETANDSMKQVSVIDASRTSVISMFLLDNKLAVIGYARKNPNETLTDDYEYSDNKTRCDYYDITNINEPKFLYSTSQDGYYIDSRAIENTVYVITKYLVHDYSIPECNNLRIGVESIYIPDYINSSSYTIITAFDSQSQNNNFKSVISILGGASTIYSGTENLYFTEYAPSKGENYGFVSSSNTAIYKIHLNDGILALNACGFVEGSVKDQFSLDESNGILRVATHIKFAKIEGENISFDRENTANRVYCLNENLQIIGKSEDIGISEEIKSVRYIGNIAYVVTFRQTDPLYAIDLTDPQKPKTLSELKIDGFSTYMHPYGSKYMIGIGYDADPETGITTGLKVTVFDISNPADIFDVSSYIVKWNNDNSVHYETEAAFNHKALLIDYNKGIIAIPLTKTTYVVETIFEEPYTYEEWTSHTKTSFIFLSFDGKSLKENATIDISEYTDDYYHSNRNIRAHYIGNYGYIIDNEKIFSISLKTMEIIAEIIFE